MKIVGLPEKRDNLPSVRLLIIERAVVPARNSTRWHAHVDWQAEFVISGRQVVRLEAASHNLRKGSVALIPPHVVHRFEYPLGDSDTSSVRFSVTGLNDGLRPEVVHSTVESRGIRNQFVRLLSQDSPAPPRRIRAFEHLLAALLDMQYSRDAEPMTESDLVRSVRDHLRAQQGRPVSVENLARVVGYSRSRLSELFLAQAGMTLKQFIDRHRVSVAEALLNYSDDKTSNIADSMGFPDLYTFSRFFKRMKGISPRAFRKKTALPGRSAGP